jgi:parallel beta-helix repeat protein
VVLAVISGGLLVTARADASDCPVSPGPVIDVTTCPMPAVPDDNEDDTDAINHAVEQIHGLDGGRVYFPSGTYNAAGIIHRSGVELNGPASATLRRLPGDTSIVIGETTDYIGDTTAGSTTITGLANTTHFEPGAVVAVLGGAGGSNAQRTTLAAPVWAQGSPFILSNGAGFSTYTEYLLIDSEIIKYVSQSGSRNATLQGVSRGRFLTPIAAHSSGAIVRQLQRMYARVVSVGTNSVTLDRPVAKKLVNTVISVGSINMSVSGLTLDGNRAQSTANTFPLKYELARNVTIRDTTIVDGAHGGIRLSHGTADALVENNVLRNNGDGASRLGAAIWLFQSAGPNTIRNNQIGGDGDTSFVGVFADDRTDIATEWDGPSNGNTIEGNTVAIPRQGNDNYAIGVQGSSTNTIRGNEVHQSFDGIRLHNSTQGSNPLASLSNVVSSNRLVGNENYAITVTGRQNTISGNNVLESGNNCKDSTGTPPKNTWTANTTDDGSACPAGATTQAASTSASSPAPTSTPLLNLGSLLS